MDGEAPGARPGLRYHAGQIHWSCSDVEVPVTLVINILIFAAIVLVPLGLAFVFMRLRRRFSSY